MPVCMSASSVHAYESRTDDWILMMFTYKIDIYEMLKLSQGQGHKVKAQGQICNFVKNLFWLYIMNQLLDMDDTYTHDWYK